MASCDASGRYDTPDYLGCLEALVAALESMRPKLQSKELTALARYAAGAMKRAFDESDVIYEPVTELIQRLKTLAYRANLP